MDLALMTYNGWCAIKPKQTHGEISEKLFDSKFVLHYGFHFILNFFEALLFFVFFPPVDCQKTNQGKKYEGLGEKSGLGDVLVEGLLL